jgi:glycosyltransferase involved in cell wall biosynthesis
MYPLRIERPLKSPFASMGPSLADNLRNSQRIKILCLGGDLNGGGAERVQLELLRRMDRGIFDIRLAYLRESGDLRSFVPLDLEPQYLAGGVPKVRLNPLGALRRLYALARDADLILAMQECTPTYLAVIVGRIQRKPVVGWVHVSISSAMNAYSPWHRFVGPALYRRAARLVGVSGGVVQDLRSSYRVRIERLCTILNPIDLLNVRTLAADSLPPQGMSWFSKPSILGIGRLVKQKRFDLLIRAFVQEVGRGADIHLILLGKGPEQHNLEVLAKELGVSERVFFAGFQTNPYPFIKAATVLASSSDYEGLGMVLLESMAIGTPVISTDCPSGPSEILEGGRHGILTPVGDWESLGSAIGRMLMCEVERKTFISRALLRVEDFQIDRQTKCWEKLLMGVGGFYKQ